MPSVISPPSPRRNTELLLLVLALGIALGANLLGALGTEQPITDAHWIQIAVLAGASLVLHVVLRLRAAYADPYLLPITVGLNGLGIALIIGSSRSTRSRTQTPSWAGPSSPCSPRPPCCSSCETTACCAAGPTCSSRPPACCCSCRSCPGWA